MAYTISFIICIIPQVDIAICKLQSCHAVLGMTVLNGSVIDGTITELDDTYTSPVGARKEFRLGSCRTF